MNELYILIFNCVGNSIGENDRLSPYGVEFLSKTCYLEICLEVIWLKQLIQKVITLSYDVV